MFLFGRINQKLIFMRNSWISVFIFELIILLFAILKFNLITKHFRNAY